MRVVISEDSDISGWLILASLVEPWVGPLVSSTAFHRTLLAAIDDRSAFCLREKDGPPGAPLLGGLLGLAEWRRYWINWLAVAPAWHGLGIGRRLVEHVFDLATGLEEVCVTTFGPDEGPGLGTREFYMHLGFKPAEISSHCGPEGQLRQVFRRPMAS